MVLSPLNQNMTAYKSWFMFDDKIVALGNVTSTNGGEVETIVENRRLAGNKVFTVDGEEKLTNIGDEAELTDVKWAHLEGNTENNSDIGYYFLENGSVKAGKIHRTDKWSTVNSYMYPEGDPEVSDDYLTMYYDHGI